MSFLAHVLVLTTFAAMAFAADDSSLSSATLPICSPVGPVWRFCTNVSSTEFLGNITSTNADVIRDLGFHGTVGKYHINSYGDTFGCSVKNSTHQINCTIPIGGNTAAFSTDDPVQVTDWNLHEDTLWNNLTDLPFQFCDYDATENPRYDWGMGITNAVETGTNKGILFFAPNYRPFSPRDQWVTTPGITGSGVAIIDTSGSYPTCTRTATKWWDRTEPIFGDHGAVDGRDGYIYAFGQPLQTALELYLTRVPKGQAANSKRIPVLARSSQRFHKRQALQSQSGHGRAQEYPSRFYSVVPYLNGWISVSRDPGKSGLIAQYMQGVTTNKSQGIWMVSRSARHNSFGDLGAARPKCSKRPKSPPTTTCMLPPCIHNMTPRASLCTSRTHKPEIFSKLSKWCVVPSL